MTDKQIIIDGVDVSGCVQFIRETETGCALGGNCKGWNCCYKRLTRKTQSEEKLVKQIQTICDFINNRPEIFKGIHGSVDKIITEYTERKEQECKELKRKITKIFTCLIKANKAGVIKDTLWVDDITTLWDYIAQTLGIEGDQIQIEKQVEMLYRKGEFSDFYKSERTELTSKRSQLKQTLIEIKAIAGEAKTACESCSERYTDGCTGYKDFENEGDCTHCGIGARANLAKQILQKISECEVEK